MTIYGQVIIICLKREEAGKRKVSSKKNGHTCFVDMSDLLTVGNTLQNGAFHNQFTVKWPKKGFLLPYLPRVESGQKKSGFGLASSTN